MQDNLRLHHLEQPDDWDSPLSRDFKENILFLLIIIVWSKQTQPGAFITSSKSFTKTQIQRDNPNLNPNLENLEI